MDSAEEAARVKFYVISEEKDLNRWQRVSEQIALPEEMAVQTSLSGTAAHITWVCRVCHCKVLASAAEMEIPVKLCLF